MTIPRYGVLKGSFVAGAPATHGFPHYQLHVQFTTQDGQQQGYEVPINTKSQDYPYPVLYLMESNFQNEQITSQLVNLAPGYHELQNQPGGVALDYVQENLFNWSDMKPVPTDGLDDDIAQFTNNLPAEAVLYLFGQQYGNPSYNSALNFQPDGGIHDIHMNQGDTGKWANEDGPYQDGGMLINIPSTNQWYGVFFAFQSQAEHLEQLGEITVSTDNAPSIAAALVNPQAGQPQNISLVNGTDHPTNLDGWKLTSNNQVLQTLSGEIAPGAYRTVTLAGSVIPVGGGNIALLDANGQVVHAVTYQDHSNQTPGLYVKFE